MGAIKVKLKANSILETVVAMVIIVAIFGIAASIFIRSATGAASMKKLKAEQLLTAFAADTRAQLRLVDTDEQVDSFEVKQQVARVNESDNLWDIHFSIYDKDHTLLAGWQEYLLAGK